MEDPLESYDGLSLFSRSLSYLSNQSPRSHDPLSLHNFLKSLPVRDPDKLFEEGEGILDSRKRKTITETMKDLASEKENEDPGEQITQNLRVRRPGIGRKHARFSLIDDSSQPSVNFEPTLDIDKYKDPEEFFLAFERFENAKKEIAKQTGNASASSNTCSTTIVPRPRRPGIEGRSRTVKYRHLYPISSSQEIFEEDTFNQGSQQETSDLDEKQETDITAIASEQREQTDVVLGEDKAKVAGLMDKTDNEISKLLDNLLARDLEELDGDETFNLLQNQLNIKYLDIEKLKLPEMKDIPKIDPSLKVVRSKTPMKQINIKSSIRRFGSPTPKSPFSSLSLLRKNISQSKSSNDPFSAINIDEIPSTSASNRKNLEISIRSFGSPITPRSPLSSLSLLRKNISESKSSNDPVPASDIDNKLSTDASIAIVDENHEAAALHKDSIFRKLKPPVIDKDGQSVDPACLSKDPSRDFTTLHNVIDENLSGNASEDLSHVNSCTQMEDKNVSGNGGVANKYFIHQSTYEDASINETNRFDDMVEDMTPDRVISMVPDLTSHKIAPDNAENTQNENGPVAVEDPADIGSAPEGTQDAARSQIQDTEAERHFGLSEAAAHGHDKVKSPPHKERRKKVPAGRQSLAASGTSWTSGVRRSSRIRSRPLKYWKGERFLYGRIHESLATVIGIKYMSPVKGNKSPTLKVKSFVSDKYKDLVELAARF